MPEATPIFDEPGRGRIYNSIIETIGNTPLVRLSRLCAEEGTEADVLAKLEFFNPIATHDDDPGLFRVARVDQHFVCHY